MTPTHTSAETVAREWITDQQRFVGIENPNPSQRVVDSLATLIDRERLMAKIELLQLLEDDFRIHATEFRETRSYVDAGLASGMAELMGNIRAQLNAAKEDHVTGD